MSHALISVSILATWLVFGNMTAESAWAAGNPARTTTTLTTEGWITHIGQQRRIFETGRADRMTTLGILAGLDNLYALGPAEGLDGEITVFDSKPYISKVTGPGDGDYSVTHSLDQGAIFLAWTQNRDWVEVAIPDTITTFTALESFVQSAARARGFHHDQPIPFLIKGKAREILWHINVDRSGGQPITREIFRKSKRYYTLQNETVDIFGIHSTKHGGIFIGQGFSIHIHLVSRESKATGHIDAINPAGLTLYLPKLPKRD